MAFGQRWRTRRDALISARRAFLIGGHGVDASQAGMGSAGRGRGTDHRRRCSGPTQRRLPRTRRAQARSPDATPPYAAKTAIYEILGPPGTTGVVNWMDAESLPQKANFTTLPWSQTIVAEMPGIFAYVVAQGDGPSIGCRITVDGKLVDQQQANTRDAQVSCLDKSA